MSRTRIILLVVVPSLLITLMVLYFYGRSAYKTETAQAVDQLEKDGRLFASALNRNCDDLTKQVNIFSSLLTMNTGIEASALLLKTMQEHSEIQSIVIAYDPEFLKSVRDGKHPHFQLENYFSDYKDRQTPEKFAFITYLDKNGTVKFAEDSDNFYETKDWYLLPRLSERGQWTNAFMTTKSNTWVCAYGLPFYHNRDLAGIVTCFLRMENLTRENTNDDIKSFGYDATRYMIINASGRFIYHSKHLTLPKFSLYSISSEMGHPELSEKIDYLLDNHEGVNKFPYLGSDYKTHSGAEEGLWLVSSRMSGESNWTVAAALDQSVITSAINRHVLRVSLATLMIMLVITGVVATIMVYANEPVLEMCRVANEIAVGNYSVHVPERLAKSHNEMGRFVRIFNEMIVALRKNTEMERTKSATQARIEQEQDIAQELQTSFLPSDALWYYPEKRFAIQATLVPARDGAGDFYDYWFRDDKTVVFFFADVSGRGVSAITTMVAARTLLRQVSQKSESPSETLNEVNRILLKENREGLFITAFLAFYHFDTGRLTYCNAGQIPPIALQINGNITPLGYAENTVLGAIPNLEFKSDEIILKPEDILFFYTNGVVNQLSGSDEHYGQNRLFEQLREQSVTTTDRIIPNLVREFENFREEQPVFDDITLLILKRTLPLPSEKSAPWVQDQTFQSDYGKSDSFVDYILQVLEKRNWSQRDIFAINMAMVEGINNAIEHGNALDTSKNYYMSCRISDNKFYLSIRDEGPGFHEDTIPDPRQRRRLSCPTGRGILLIRSFMSRVWFNDSGNEIFMEKFRSEYI